jgi:hypothetical protein
MVIMVEITAVLAKARSLNFCIQPVWVSRDDPRLQKAYSLSKRIDTDNWCIPFSSFIGLFDTFGPFSVDLFATRDNFKVKKFYALTFEPRCSGVDAFVHCWDGEKIYAAPPVSLIIRFIRKLAESKAVSGLLLIPLWKSAKFWNFGFSDGRHLNGLFSGFEKRHILTDSWDITHKDRIGRKAITFLCIWINLCPSESPLESVVGSDRCIRIMFGKPCFCDGSSE